MFGEVGEVVSEATLLTALVRGIDVGAFDCRGNIPRRGVVFGNEAIQAELDVVRRIDVLGLRAPLRTTGLEVTNQRGRRGAIDAIDDPVDVDRPIARQQSERPKRAL